MIVLDHLERARERVLDERRRTATQQAAFETFTDCVGAIDVRHPDTERTDGSGPDGFDRNDASATRVIATDRTSASGRGLRAVAESYRETVMETPVYRAEYDDSLAESLAEEVGPDLAAGLRAADQLTPQLHEAVLAAGRQAHHERAILLEHLDGERTSIKHAFDPCEEVEATIRELDEARVETWSADSLTATTDRLRALDEDCEALVDRRQDLLQRRSNAPERELVEPSLTGYLYRDEAFTYPVLATAASAVEGLREQRMRLERAVARTS